MRRHRYSYAVILLFLQIYLFPFHFIPFYFYDVFKKCWAHKVNYCRLSNFYWHSVSTNKHLNKNLENVIWNGKPIIKIAKTSNGGWHTPNDGNKIWSLLLKVIWMKSRGFQCYVSCKHDFYLLWVDLSFRRQFQAKLYLIKYDARGTSLKHETTFYSHTPLCFVEDSGRCGNLQNLGKL